MSDYCTLSSNNSKNEIFSSSSEITSISSTITSNSTTSKNITSKKNLKIYYFSMICICCLLFLSICFIIILLINKQIEHHDDTSMTMNDIMIYDMKNEKEMIGKANYIIDSYKKSEKEMLTMFYNEKKNVYFIMLENKNIEKMENEIDVDIIQGGEKNECFVNFCCIDENGNIGECYNNVPVQAEILDQLVERFTGDFVSKITSSVEESVKSFLLSFHHMCDLYNVDNLLCYLPFHWMCVGQYFDNSGSVRTCKFKCTFFSLSIEQAHIKAQSILEEGCRTEVDYESFKEDSVHCFDH